MGGKQRRSSGADKSITFAYPSICRCRISRTVFVVVTENVVKLHREYFGELYIVEKHLSVGIHTPLGRVPEFII